MRAHRIALALLLAGCSASGALTSPLPPVANESHVEDVTHRHGKARVAAVVRIPRKHRRAGRHPDFISSGTKSLSIIGLGSPIILDVSTCPTSSGYAQCSFSATVDAGGYDVSGKAWDQPNAAGNVLAQGFTHFTVAGDGATNYLDLTLQAFVAYATVTQSAILAGGSASSATLSLQALDASGAAITGTTPFAEGEQLACPSLFSSSCPLIWLSPTAPASLSASYDGVTGFASMPAFGIGVGGGLDNNPISFVPAMDSGISASPTSLTFGAPPAAPQSVTISGDVVSNVVLDGCGSATTAIAGNVVTLTPAMDTTQACTMLIYGGRNDSTPYSFTSRFSIDPLPWSDAVYVPIGVGGSAVPADPIYGMALPARMTFPSASSASQTLTIVPPPGYSGPVHLYEGNCYAATVSSGTSGWWQATNSVPMASIVSVAPASLDGSSVNGAPVTFTVTPKARGSCELFATNVAADSSDTFPTTLDTFLMASLTVGP